MVSLFDGIGCEVTVSKVVQNEKYKTKYKIGMGIWLNKYNAKVEDDNQLFVKWKTRKKILNMVKLIIKIKQTIFKENKISISQVADRKIPVLGGIVSNINNHQ